ncbi:heme lyase CcmF/NrfE family subunit [Marinomonas sp. M1K-6]|uniref:Heme lyase CcmF/NrfE family subunit n=1 Tax=Marinomonas profundi TaxID=2726122 RepID=A0A847R8H7_9GAMM|nr:heme lyase CcmF/NrfE family subunit [Marinomonas profundi]NLQ16570.1 heme lyase CcmF/NrfE family subunit [Marinomonas profundi]UDV03843.1 heme lyase CcmF/NrfE family subunit [Marinomonas profundi]
MLPEIGQFSLILSLFFALFLSSLPLIGYWQGNRLLLETARPLTFIMSVLVLVSFVLLSVAFLMDDFSVLYVSQNSSSQLPVWYKFSALWSGHEGSLLLWVLILAGWCSAVALKSSTLPEDIGPVVLSVLGMVCLGFLSFLLFTSSPFARLLPDVPLNGGDLNPLLQDFGLIVHPPVLYMGYVGFSVTFAFAVTALITGNLNASWARWARPWTATAWAFLTLGITLGSWWAYYELGWGGWWFWDPVENASFMPWLAGTALLHSLAVTEKRGVFKSWTVLLAIFTFSLSLLGAFLVRSGVLTSVHSFAADPTRGLFILVLLLVFVGGSLLLYAIRAAEVRSSVSFGATGREAWLLLNNILLTVLTLTVLLGTLYPLIFDVLGLGKISVGAPYFNSVFTPIALLLMVFMAVGPLSKWHHTTFNVLFKPCLMAAIVSMLAAALLVYYYQFGFLAWLSLTVAFWVVVLSFLDWFEKVSAGTKGIIPRARQLPRNYYAMLLAHLGMVVTLVGIVMVSVNSKESMLRLSPGDRVTLAGYEFQFDQMVQVKGPNYVASKGQFTAYKANKAVAVLHPEKRFFTTRQQVMTEAALDAGFTRDLYVSLGEQLDDSAWGVRIYVKSFVRWIWLGGLMMMAGGLLAAVDKRYRKRAGI